MKKDYSKLKRHLNTMPSYVKKALEERGLNEDFYDRPPYQQNDYLSWIEGAKREETKEKRLFQMLNELEVGGVYMKMSHPSSSKK
ncbi:MAG: YdeI/OmpD-associated family protein [Campylobacterota bacterium]|nr:YdeI/OmpD-associated family protein [Campylobacterota bacterium]